jgi:hypothetical protein
MAPLRKHFALVAGNDAEHSRYINRVCRISRTRNASLMPRTVSSQRHASPLRSIDNKL